MAKKRVTIAYSPIDYDSIPSPNVHQTEINRYGHECYQQGWNGKEISNPKLLYYDEVGRPKSKSFAAESRTNYEQEKPKDIKSQIKRAFSMKKENGESQLRHKPLAKAKSCEAIDLGRREKSSGNKHKIGLYHGLENIINSYSDNFGYDGRKEYLAKRNSNERGYSAGYEPYMDNYGKKYDNSKLSPNISPVRNLNKNHHGLTPGYHTPATALDLVLPELKKELASNLSSKVSSNIKENSGLPKPNPAGSVPKPNPTVTIPKPNSAGCNLVASSPCPVISPGGSPSRKVPPPVKPKPKKVPHMNAVTDDKEENTSIPKLVDLGESILHKLSSWKEITKEITDLVSQLEALISLMRKPVCAKRKPSLTESIASALDSFSFLAADYDNDGMSDVTPLPDDIQLTSPHTKYYPAVFHHLSALYDLIVGFQPSSGPLNAREFFYYDKIKQQNIVIKQLSRVISDVDNLSLKYACEQFCENETLADIWNSCATNSEPLHCTTKKFTEALNLLFQDTMYGLDDNNNDQYVNTSEVREGVCAKVVNELCELDIFKTDVKIITLFQFVGFFKNKVKCHHITDYLKKCIEEFLMLKVLFSKDDLLVMSTLQQYWKIPVVKSCLQCLLLFIAGDRELRKGASLHALMKLHENPENKYQVLAIVVASLEESNIKIKAGACIALGKLKVQGISKKLIYLFETDKSLVKEAAESGLKDLGHNLIRR